jgi:predicted 3-demethylubiquinone-9 3-methyltransferase (glyoxalase superfamily)
VVARLACRETGQSRSEVKWCVIRFGVSWRSACSKKLDAE